MARLIRYVPNLRGVGALRKSDAMDAMLEGRAQRVATQAEATYGALGHEADVEVVQAGSDTDERSRVAVIARLPYAMRVEAKHRVLGGSLDAARG